jgi:hypothetical protein
MSSSKNTEERFWQIDPELTPVESMTTQQLLVNGLRRRQWGEGPSAAQAEAVAAFDAADLAGKRAMLGEDAWPSWEPIVTGDQSRHAS